MSSQTGAARTRVLLDGHELSASHHRGIATYLRHLVDGLPADGDIALDVLAARDVALPVGAHRSPHGTHRGPAVAGPAARTAAASSAARARRRRSCTHPGAPCRRSRPMETSTRSPTAVTPVITDSAVAARCITTGLARAAHHTWSASVDAHIATYRAAASG